MTQHTQDLPHALDLANWLNSVSTGLSANQAAAELRRLHAESERLTVQRDELLLALKDVLAAVRYSSGLPETVHEFEQKVERVKKAAAQAQSAIHKAEGGTP